MNISEKRIELIREMLLKKSISSFLISNNFHCEYVSGLRSSNQYLLITSNQKFLFTDFRYKQAAEKISEKNGFTFIELSGNSLSDTLRAQLKEDDKLGIQSDEITVDFFDKLKDELGDIEIIKLPSIIPELIAPKCEDEISSMRQAALIADSAFKELLNVIDYGISEKELAAKLNGFCREGGSESPSFETIVLFGERAALPHGVPSERELQKGDYILCDFGCTVKGYCSDMTRTLFFVDTNPKQQEIFATVNRAREEAIRVVKEGVKASYVDKIARDIICNAGYGDYFGHGTGHGVGREVHEFPAVNSRNDTILKEGMIITVEPGIYLPDHGGVRIEDMVLVKKNGSQLITSFTRDMLVLQEGKNV